MDCDRHFIRLPIDFYFGNGRFRIFGGYRIPESDILLQNSV